MKPLTRRVPVRVLVYAALWAGVVASGFSQPPPMSVASPEVQPNGVVTFRLLAPNAKVVTLHGEFAKQPIAMTRNEAGIWAATVGPMEPNVYGYGFTMDGLNLPDPSNTFVRVGALSYESQVEVPGESAAFLAIRDVPHGAVHEHWYYSRDLKTTRRVLVYTPPGYETGAVSAYPVLYLLHGMGDDEGFWTSVGRANFIMDNLLAEHKAKPAVIVMPFGHASRRILGFSRRPIPGDTAPPSPPIDEVFGLKMLETDLKENVIPLVERQYRVSKDRKQRAIAGLSMGGYQSLVIGLNNLPMFSYVAGFSSALIGPEFAAHLQPFLSNSVEANARLKLLWLGCGADDGLLPFNRSFEELLQSKGIHHEWVVTPGYAHAWTLWRVYLRDLLPKLFN